MAPKLGSVPWGTPRGQTGVRTVNRAKSGVAVALGLIQEGIRQLLKDLLRLKRPRNKHCTLQ